MRYVIDTVCIDKSNGANIYSTVEFTPSEIKANTAKKVPGTRYGTITPRYLENPTGLSSSFSLSSGNTSFCLISRIIGIK